MAPKISPTTPTHSHTVTLPPLPKIKILFNTNNINTPQLVTTIK